MIKGVGMPRIPYERIGEYVRTALQILVENEDTLPSREVVQKSWSAAELKRL